MQVDRRPRKVAKATTIEVLGLLVLILVQFPFLLSGDMGPLDADYGRIFLGPLFEVREALFDGRPLLWDSMRYGGTPYWALPNTAPVYPPLVIALLLRGPIGATNLVLIAHLLAGAWGTRALAREVGVGRFAAFLAAAAFLYAPLTRLYGLNQPWATMAMAFLPWTLHQVVRRANGADWRVCGIIAGLLYAATPWCGGYVVFLPGLLVTGFLSVGFTLRSPVVRELIRTVSMLALMVAVLVTVSAGRLLPSTRWTAITDRAESLDLYTTIADAFTLTEVFEWLRGTGFLAIALAVFAVGVGLAGRRKGALPFGLSAIAMILFACGLPQRAFFHEWIPGFDRIRDPRHFWSPLVVVVPVLVAIAVDFLAVRFTPRNRTVALALGGLLVAALCLEPRVWAIVREQPAISLSERVEANALHLELARRAESEPLFRVHDARDTRPKVKRTADVLRCALALPSIEGLLGNISVNAYDKDFIIPSRRQGPRLWGFLNCVYVTSQEPLDDPDLELIDVYAEDPDELNPGMDGPYLYRNLRVLPRAYLARRAVLLLDANLFDRRRMLTSTLWSADTEVLIRADRADIELSREFLSNFGAVIGAGQSRGDRVLAKITREAGARPRGMPPIGQENGSEFALFLEPGPPIQPLPSPARVWNGARIELDGVTEDAWLVLAETYSIYPGWTAEVDGVGAPILIANGAATAVPVPAGAREVVLAYSPPGLFTGMLITFGGLTFSILSLVVLTRREPGLGSQPTTAEA